MAKNIIKSFLLEQEHFPSWTSQPLLQKIQLLVFGSQISQYDIEVKHFDPQIFPFKIYFYLHS